MSREKGPLGHPLQRLVLDASHKALEALLADERRALVLARALGSVQRGKQALDRGQLEVMRALGLASQADFKAVGKQLSGLKRRLRALEEKLADLSGE